MMLTELRCIAYFWCVVNAPLGFVLPEFGIAYCCHTLGSSIRTALRFALVWKALRPDPPARHCVIRRTKRHTRPTPSTKLAATKSA